MTKLWIADNSQWVKAGASPVPFASASSRDQLVYETYKPGPTTTGVLPGSVLTTYTAASQLPGGGLIGGSTYVNCRFQFVVTPPTGTSTITFRNCLFEGQNASPGDFVGLAKLYNGGHCPVVFYDCTFRPQRPSRFWNGMHGHTFKAYRCDISYVIDAWSIFNNNAGQQSAPINVEVWGCYGHDFAWWAAGTGDIGPPNGGGENSFDGSHNDGVQLQGGTGFIFRGNNLQAYNAPDYFQSYYGDTYANTGLILQDNVGTTTGMDIRGNWLAGGAANINVTGALRNLGTIKKNIFAPNSSRGNDYFLRNPGQTVDTGTNGVDANIVDTSPPSLTAYDPSRPVIFFSTGA